MKPLKLICTLLMAGAPAMAPSASTQAAAYDGAAWLNDYAQLKKIMEKDYANLAWFASPEGGLDLPSLDRKTLQALHAAHSDEDARQAITRFVAAFKGGHFSVQQPQAKAQSTPQAVPAKPFDAGDATGVCAAQEFLPTSRIAFSLPLETLPNFQLLADGLTSVYSAGIATAADGRKIGVIRLQNFRMQAFPATCALALAELRAKGAKIDARSLRDAADEKWLSALKEQTAALKAAGITALMIDVGNNSGGNDSGDLFARLLTDKPVRSARLRVTANRAGKAMRTSGWRVSMPPSPRRHRSRRSMRSTKRAAFSPRPGKPPRRLAICPGSGRRASPGPARAASGS